MNKFLILLGILVASVVAFALPVERDVSTQREDTEKVEVPANEESKPELPAVSIPATIVPAAEEDEDNADTTPEAAVEASEEDSSDSDSDSEESDEEPESDESNEGKPSSGSVVDKEKDKVPVTVKPAVPTEGKEESNEEGSVSESDESSDESDDSESDEDARLIKNSNVVAGSKTNEQIIPTLVRKLREISENDINGFPNNEETEREAGSEDEFGETWQIGEGEEESTKIPEVTTTLEELVEKSDEFSYSEEDLEESIEASDSTTQAPPAQG